MFARWGRIVARHRRPIAIAALLTIVLSIAVMVTVAPDLSSEGFLSDNAESSRVDATVSQQFGQGGDTLIFLFDVPGKVTDPGMQQKVETALAPITTSGDFRQVLTTWNSGSPNLIANDGTATYAIAYRKPDVSIGNGQVDDFTSQVEDAAKGEGLTVTTGGSLAIGNEISSEVEQGIVRAESVAIPLTVIMLLLVFGSAVAASLPLLIGVLAILLAIGGLFILSQEAFSSVFAINVITMLGLGLGIDYSLFMVTRFREEITRRSPDEAVAVTMATTGKAILFSGITVIFGLSATQFFPLPALQSMGEAGILVTIAALIYGLTLLPAILTMLGSRVNRLAVRLPSRRRSIAEPGATHAAGSGFWYRLADLVMRRPVQILLPLLIVLLVAGTPVFGLNLTPGGPDVLPKGDAARTVNDRINSEFPGGSTTVPVLVTFPQDLLTTASATDRKNDVTQLQALVARFGQIPGVTSVDSIFSVPGFDWTSWNGEVSTLPAAIQTIAGSTIRGGHVLIKVNSNASNGPLEDVARALRKTSTDALQVEVGGSAAQAVDTVDGINAGVVPAAIFVFVGAYLILLFTFGSVFLPLKAMFMSLLSISASLGVVVLIFQDGHLQSFFGFDATGEIVAVIPVLMFCILFGLSMDYEVLMLSRIQEEYERTGDNRASVAFGLSHTGRVITGAAGIMIVAFGGFMLADIVIIKSLGFGLAFAVLIDATIVRGLLVPATMRLMGTWNWWAPAPIKRIVDAAGLSHHSDLTDFGLRAPEVEPSR